MDEELEIFNPQDLIKDAIESTGAQQSSDDSLTFTFPTNPSASQTGRGPIERGTTLDPVTGQPTEAFQDNPLTGGQPEPLDPLSGRGLEFKDLLENPEFIDELIRRTIDDIGYNLRVARKDFTEGAIDLFRDLFNDPRTRNLVQEKIIEKYEDILEDLQKAPGGAAGLAGIDFAKQAIQAGPDQVAKEIGKPINDFQQNNFPQ
jgi:hypothetical protein